MNKAFDQRRRRVIQGAGTLALAVGAPAVVRAQDRKIVVSDPGGPYATAYSQAFYDPFEKATGIKVIRVARESQPAAQVEAMVKSRNYLWDATILTLSEDIPYLEEKGMLEPMGLKHSDFPHLLPDAVRPDWLGVDVYATILAYRDKGPKAVKPKSWADFWDVKHYPGRRSLRRSPIDTLEEALLADGVAPEHLYPLDVDRAFRSLDKIKPHISLWWTSGAQCMQAIQSGEVDMISSWNGRAQAAKDAGAPVVEEWNQGIFSIEGWGIPKGTPRAALVKEFVRFCADAKRQSVITKTLAYGPTNLQAYQWIPAARAAVLPTAPQNIHKMILSNPQWWKANREKVTQRFTSWIIA